MSRTDGSLAPFLQAEGMRHALFLGRSLVSSGLLVVVCSSCEATLGAEPSVSEGGSAGESGVSSGGGGAQGQEDACQALYENVDPGLAVSFRADLVPLMQARCTSLGCHGGDDLELAQARLWLGPRDREATAAEVEFIYRSLLDVQSVVAPQLALVRGHNPRESYFMRKIDACQEIEGVRCVLDPADYRLPCGDPMPSIGVELSDEERAKFRSWIQQGAEQN